MLFMRCCLLLCFPPTASHVPRLCTYSIIRELAMNVTKSRLLEQNSTPVCLILSELSANSTVAECEVTTQNGNRGNESVHFTKESIYLLRTHHTFTLTLKAAPIDSNESLGMNPPRNMTCVRLAVCGLGFI